MVCGWYYAKYAARIDAKLHEGPFADTFNIFAAPQSIAVGDSMTPEELAARLRQGEYGTSRENPVGWYNMRLGAVEIYPGRDSYTDLEPAVIHFAKGKIARIVSLDDDTIRTEYPLEPQLITNVSDKTRAKRRLVRYSEIPATLVNAVLSAEDKHFFHHSGFDILRIGKAAWVDVKEGRKEQGASTLSMQLTRGLWLDQDKSWRRKAAELLMTLHLETRLTKQQIFEYYSNQVYLGRRGSFSINGFGEGTHVYFGKDIGKLTVPEAATLAGMVQRPSYFNPFRYPQRTRERRNVVLGLMRQNGLLGDAEYSAAIASPLTLSSGGDPATRVDAQYFVDRVNDDLQERFGDSSAGASYVYTTLDPGAQRAAREAVRTGMEHVDKLLGAKKRGLDRNQPQVALIALDPHTGEVKALVGGRDYGASQLDHVLARRQPGSVFKPFVYAAALDTAIEGGPTIFTPASTLMDEPTTFQFANQSYAPGNFHQQFMGVVTLRRALSLSLNVATVKLAQMVGYQHVVDMARRCGMPDNLRPTPAVALGAYEATPLDVAGAYTVFANRGDYVKPALVLMVRSRKGEVLYRYQPRPRHALDPRVSYLVVNLLEEVMRSGTGAGARAHGFRLPAAGKTGTSHDGWFAGFSSELLCVVWVGFDDNRELGLEGSKAALPIWADFMKRAHALHQYRDAASFAAPDGIVSARICEESGELASPLCPATHSELFIDGSQPVVECRTHGFPEQFADRYEAPSAGLLPVEPVPVAPAKAAAAEHH